MSCNISHNPMRKPKITITYTLFCMETYHSGETIRRHEDPKFYFGEGKICCDMHYYSGDQRPYSGVVQEDYGGEYTHIWLLTSQ